MIVSNPPCLLSFVVPVYNAGAYLSPCLDSLLATAVAIEVVAVDDGSSDGSAAVLARYREADARVRVITQANAGVSRARNVGLAAARGDWVWFVDADDWLAGDACLTLVPLLADPSLHAIAFNGQRAGDAAAMPLYRYPKANHKQAGETWLATLCEQREWRHLVWLYVFRRSHLAQQNLRFHEGIVHEDIAFLTEAVVSAPALRYVAMPLYHYRVNADSLTGDRSDAARLRRVRSYFTVLEQLREINRRCRMQSATRKLLRAEVVGQGVEMTRLIGSLSTPALRAELLHECRETGFWRGLWADASTWRRKRQVLLQRLRTAFSRPPRKDSARA